MSLKSKVTFMHSALNVPATAMLRIRTRSAIWLGSGRVVSRIKAYDPVPTGANMHRSLRCALCRESSDGATKENHGSSEAEACIVLYAVRGYRVTLPFG